RLRVEEWRYLEFDRINQYPIESAETNKSEIRLTAESARMDWLSELTEAHQAKVLQQLESVRGDSPFIAGTVGFFTDVVVVSGSGNARLQIGGKANALQSVILVVNVNPNDALSLAVETESEGAVGILVVAKLEDGATLSIDGVTTVDTVGFSTFRITQGALSHFKWTLIGDGIGTSVTDLAVTHAGIGAATEINALSLGRQESRHIVHTSLSHQVVDGQSAQQIKSILTDGAVSEFKGTVYVAKGAQRTDSSQRNANLVLSDKARAISRPQLDIHADDVKCAHGATMSQLSDDQLYYLQSRGLSRAMSQSVLMVGFADEIIQMIGDGETREKANRRARHFYEAVNE
ncbi:SufD family Fe-S cluster assembly protein, partial [bacterium]|nr:SufD family Fe-S cluster assembly protein [bacterium]